MRNEEWRYKSLRDFFIHFPFSILHYSTFAIGYRFTFLSSSHALAPVNTAQKPALSSSDQPT